MQILKQIKTAAENRPEHPFLGCEDCSQVDGAEVFQNMHFHRKKMRN